MGDVPIPAHARDALAALQRGNLMVDAAFKARAGVVAYKRAQKGLGANDWHTVGSEVFMASGVGWLVANGLAAESLGLVTITDAGRGRGK